MGKGEEGLLGADGEGDVGLAGFDVGGGFFGNSS